jgi:hypothetical protein
LINEAAHFFLYYEIDHMLGKCFWRRGEENWRWEDRMGRESVAASSICLSKTSLRDFGSTLFHGNRSLRRGGIEQTIS